MRKILPDRIVHVPNTPKLEEVFLFSMFRPDRNHPTRKVVFMKDLLKHAKNASLLQEIASRPASYANVYSAQDELEIFQKLCDEALTTKTHLHIVGITLDEEVKILESMYEELGFLREDINCFRVDFSQPLVTVSVNIENLMWRGSDYKRLGEQIFFIPPIREAGQTKAMYKGINRGVIASLHIDTWSQEHQIFLQDCIRQEHILPITLARVLESNLKKMGFEGVSNDLIIHYETLPPVSR